MTATSNSREPVACEFAAFSPQERIAKLNLSQRIFADCRGLTETDEGISLLFEPCVNERYLRQWIVYETQCCRFASFDLAAEKDAWILRVRSEDKGKKFLQEIYRSILGVEVKPLNAKNSVKARDL